MHSSLVYCQFVIAAISSHEHLPILLLCFAIYIRSFVRGAFHLEAEEFWGALFYDVRPREMQYYFMVLWVDATWRHPLIQILV